jgi:hypothetical protein
VVGIMSDRLRNPSGWWRALRGSDAAGRAVPPAALSEYSLWPETRRIIEAAVRLKD